MPTISHIYRYPIKGLSPEPLRLVSLEVNEPLPLDRYFALAQGTTVFDPQQPKHHPKTDFLMLMKYEQLAALRTVCDDSTGFLHIYQGDCEVLQADLQTSEGQSAVETFFFNYLGPEQLQGQPRLLQSPEGYQFSDVDAKVISCVNLASVRALGEMLECQLDPLRFRANIYFDGAPAWSELTWSTVKLGRARGKVLKPIQRCAATNVNPHTAVRDLNIPGALQKFYQHNHMGIYVQVTQAGEIALQSDISSLN